jgi:hypothetical protein
MVKKDQSGKSKPRKRLSIAARISLLLVAYVLSIGPAFWIRDHTSNPHVRESFECIATVMYWPVSTVANSFDPFQRALSSYISIWT